MTVTRKPGGECPHCKGKTLETRTQELVVCGTEVKGFMQYCWNCGQWSSRIDVGDQTFERADFISPKEMKQLDEEVMKYG